MCFIDSFNKYSKHTYYVPGAVLDQNPGTAINKTNGISGVGELTFPFNSHPLKNEQTSKEVDTNHT